MADQDNESTDGTSIKPVSSLRSHFENIGSVGTASQGLSTRASSRLVPENIPSHGDRTYERASLDIPRSPSPWTTGRESPHNESQPRMKAKGPPVTPRNERPRSAIFHRPSSARPTSPSLAPPPVTVVSPKSPPKTAHSSHTSSIQNQPPPKPSTPSGLASRSAPPLPPHFTRPNSQPQIQSPGLATSQEQTAPLKCPIPIRATNTASLVDNTSTNGPPPINRADKPKVPLKLSAKRTANLETDKMASDEKVSPFSTPPSGDDSPNQTSRTGGSMFSQPASAISPRGMGVSPFSPPTFYEPIRGDQKSFNNSVPSTSSISENFSTHGIASHGSGEIRPGLPPRRMTEKALRSSQSMRLNEARIISTGRIARQNTQSMAILPDPAPRSSRAITPASDFLPPPKRTGTSDNLDTYPNQKKVLAPASDAPSTPIDATSPVRGVDQPANVLNTLDYPDASQTNRRPPAIKQGIHEVDTTYDTRLFDFCGDYLCTTGYLTRAWDMSSGSVVMNLGHGEQTKVTALAFKPGATAEEEGLRLWMGTNFGDLYEVDIRTQSIISTKSFAHSRREIIKIYRNQNSMWSLDDSGNLSVWSPDESGLPNMQNNPLLHRVPKGHTFSLVVHRRLWLATGRDIRVFNPGSSIDGGFQLTLQPLSQQSAGEVTSGTVVSTQDDRVYFGHSDGKVTVYSTNDLSCLGIVNVSVYKISALAGAGDYLWAGYNTGMIYVYDTRTQPWTTKKDWHAHSNPVASIVVDRSSVWKTGSLHVASLGTDNAVRLWDGMLEEDWLESDMQDHDTQYCSFRELRALIVTWNAGAATPTNLRYEDKDSNFFRDVLGRDDPPDLLVFGFQELVDLEDKKLTAKSLFKGSKKKDTDHEHMSRQYRAWRDHLVRSIEDNMPSNEPYHLLHTASMVGLFSCVFVRSNHRDSICNLNAAEIKRGMGGLHGNKGCLALRFLVDDSSVCLINCHLAAGQTQTLHRNNDVSAILESVIFPPERNASIRCDSYSGGGDGSMILDHEICILNGDLNYRIDTMGRDTVVKAVQARNFTKLLERDQLLVSRRRNPGFRLRAFTESPITFAPTYKYDVGTDRYDTSEKHRAPAWCDRILYRGPGKIRQLEYRRHELRVSDHRPVSAIFKMRIKSVSHEKRGAAWQACIRRFEARKEEIARHAKIIYLRDVLGVGLEEAKSLV